MSELKEPAFYPGPIYYDPIPHPLLANPADGVDAFGDVSSVAGYNFAKLNTRLRSSADRWTVFTGAQSKISYVSGYSDWTHITDWPATTFKLPGRTEGALLVIRGQANSGPTGIYPQVSFTVDVTGPGAVNKIPSKDYASIAALWGLVTGSRQWFFKPDDLLGGQDLTLTPLVNFNDTQNGSVSYGEWVLIVFSGDPA